MATPGTILLRVKKPDGTLLPDYTSPTDDSLGEYHQDIPAADLPVIGHYAYAWITTGTAAGVASGVFDVVDPFEPELISLQDAKAHLGETGTLQDDEIRAFAQVATEVVESVVGPCTPQTFTDQVNASAGSSVLVLPRRPVISVTSVTSVYAATPAWLAADLQWDSEERHRPAAELRHVLRRAVHRRVRPAGRTAIPGRYRQAALEMLRHLWTTQRGQTVGFAAAGLRRRRDAAVRRSGRRSVSAFAIPNRVLELLAADRINRHRVSERN